MRSGRGCTDRRAESRPDALHATEIRAVPACALAGILQTHDARPPPTLIVRTARGVASPAYWTPREQTSLGVAPDTATFADFPGTPAFGKTAKRSPVAAGAFDAAGARPASARTAVASMQKNANDISPRETCIRSNPPSRARPSPVRPP